MQLQLAGNVTAVMGTSVVIEVAPALGGTVVVTPTSWSRLDTVRRHGQGHDRVAQTVLRSIGYCYAPGLTVTTPFGVHTTSS